MKKSNHLNTTILFFDNSNFGEFSWYGGEGEEALLTLVFTLKFIPYALIEKEKEN